MWMRWCWTPQAFLPWVPMPKIEGGDPLSTLAIAGFVMVIVFMYLIMSKRMSAMTALILIPLLFIFLT